MYIYSTLSNNQSYSIDGGKEVLIAGRANVANKNLITVRGVVTSVTDDELNQLRKNMVFKAHLDNGFLEIGSVKTDPEKVAENMKPKDAAAQETEETLSKKSSSRVKKSN